MNSLPKINLSLSLGSFISITTLLFVILQISTFLKEGTPFIEQHELLSLTFISSPEQISLSERANPSTSEHVKSEVGPTVTLHIFSAFNSESETLDSSK